MSNKQGYTLLEMLVCIFILGIAAAMTLPNLTAYIEQSKAQAAKNNLYAVAAAQAKYFEDNNSYCTTTTPVANCGNAANLFTSLNLTQITGDPFTYTCTSNGATTYTCTAIDPGPIDTLTLSLGAANVASVTCVSTKNQSYCSS